MERNKKDSGDKSASLYDGPLFPLENCEEVPLALIPLASIVNRLNGN